MNQRSPLPDPFSRMPFSTQQAAARGVPRSRLRSQDLTRPFHGVRASGASATMSIVERAEAYAPLLRADQFFSHTTAAALHGMRMPTSFDEEAIHVSSIAPTRAPRGKGVIGHQAADAPVVWSNGRIRASSPADTWIALGSSLPLDDLIVMGDGLISRKEPQATVEELSQMVASSAGSRGSARLRSALAWIRADTDSAPETRLRLVLTRAGCPEPEVNGIIQTARGPFHGDLVFRAHGVVVEYDGEQHRTVDLQYSIDVDRLDAMMAARWRVVRVDKRLMRTPGVVVGRVRRALADQ